MTRPVYPVRWLLQPGLLGLMVVGGVTLILVVGVPMRAGYEFGRWVLRPLVRRVRGSRHGN